MPWERSGVVLAALGEAYVPFVSLGQRVADKGTAALLPWSQPIEPGIVDWLRNKSNSRQIDVPATSSSDSPFSGAAPWSDAGSPFSGTAPWNK